MAIGQLSRFPAAAIKRRKSWVITPEMMIVAAKNRVQFREEAGRENFFLGGSKRTFFIHKKY